eukprot:16439399-Heterocapsa_arctica.AAC.1
MDAGSRRWQGTQQPSADREIKAGYVIWAETKEELERLVGALVPSRVGIIIKTKSDGTAKVRLIHNLRRSGSTRTSSCRRGSYCPGYRMPSK